MVTTVAPVQAGTERFTRGKLLEISIAGIFIGQDTYLSIHLTVNIHLTE